MLSTQPQACPPVRISRLSHTAPASAAALAGFSSFSQAGVSQDGGAPLDTRNLYFNHDTRDGAKRHVQAYGHALAQRQVQHRTL